MSELIVLDELDIDLFGPKTCSTCGRELAANSDYFAKDKARFDGLTPDCRDCRRARDRRYYATHRARCFAATRKWRARKAVAS